MALSQAKLAKKRHKAKLKRKGKQYTPLKKPELYLKAQAKDTESIVL